MCRYLPGSMADDGVEETVFGGAQVALFLAFVTVEPLELSCSQTLFFFCPTLKELSGLEFTLEIVGECCTHFN